MKARASSLPNSPTPFALRTSLPSRRTRLTSYFTSIPTNETGSEIPCSSAIASLDFIFLPTPCRVSGSARGGRLRTPSAASPRICDHPCREHGRTSSKKLLCRCRRARRKPTESSRRLLQIRIGHHLQHNTPQRPVFALL